MNTAEIIDIDFLKWYHKGTDDKEFIEWVDSDDHSIKDAIDFYSWKFPNKEIPADAYSILTLEKYIGQHLEHCRSRSYQSAFIPHGYWNIEITNSEYKIVDGNAIFQCRRTEYMNEHWYNTFLIIPKWVFEYIKNGKLTYVAAKHIRFELF